MQWDLWGSRVLARQWCCSTPVRWGIPALRPALAFSPTFPATVVDFDKTQVPPFQFRSQATLSDTRQQRLQHPSNILLAQDFGRDIATLGGHVLLPTGSDSNSRTAPLTFATSAPSNRSCNTVNCMRLRRLQQSNPPHPHVGDSSREAQQCRL